MENQKTMMLITSKWGETKTFRLIGIDTACCFIEAIYAPEHKSLAIVSKQIKQQFKLLPQIDPNGDAMFVKQGKRPNGNPYKEERKQIDVQYEHYILERNEQEEFIKMFAVNAATFDYGQYLDYVAQEEGVPQATLEVAK